MTYIMYVYSQALILRKVDGCPLDNLSDFFGCPMENLVVRKMLFPRF